MERIKLAIEKARESAEQLQRGQGGAAGVGASASTGEPAYVASGDRRPQRASGHAGSKRSTRSQTAWLVGGLAVAGGLWFMLGARPLPEAVPVRESVNATPVSAPQIAATAPRLMAEAASPSAVGEAKPVGSGEPGAQAADRDGAKPPVVLAAQVEAAVEAWRMAWAKRDMVKYLDAYSGTFAPSDGVSRQDWLASRYRNVGGRPSIEVGIRNVTVDELSPARARVSFVQDYASGSFRETGQPKTLDLALEADGRWRIVGEWSGKAAPLR